MAAQSGPPSPGTSGPQLENCMEDLLKFTLMSSIDGSLGIDIGLSKEYCSSLLKSDPFDLSPASTSDQSEVGVPPSPLYKHLASALCKCISFGAFGRKCDMVGVIRGDDELMRQKEEEWIGLISEKCSELANVLSTVEFELNVQEPFFSQLKDGLKTVEGRCAVGDYNRIASGALILFNKSLLLQVKDVHWYPSFEEMLKEESLAKVLPGVKNIEDGVQIYRKFYTEEKESLNGVLAICVTKASSQLYIPLASILLGLSYGGMQRLLGFMHTSGTIPEAIPPPRSTLLSSFALPHNPHFIGFLEPYMEAGHSKGWKH